MIIISNETRAAVQSCPPSMIQYMYAAKLGIQVTTTVVRFSYAPQFQDTLQRGWLKDDNRVQIALAWSHAVVGTECHVSMLLEWQLNIVCTALLGCSHLLFTAGGNLPNSFAPVNIMCTVWLGAKMAAICKRLKSSLQSTSNDHYIE